MTREHSRAAGTAFAGALLLAVTFTACGGGDGKGAAAEESGDRVAAASLSNWCADALPDASLEGAGTPGTFATATAWGEEGQVPVGVLCGYNTDNAGSLAIGRAEFATEAAAAEYVDEAEDESGSVDTFDAFSTSLNPDTYRYTMTLKRGATVVTGKFETCPDEETCDEAIAGLGRALADAEAPKLDEECAGPDGDEYGVIPLSADGEHEAFALTNSDGQAVYVATTGAGGLSSNVLFTMEGHAVEANDVEVNSSGEPVSVEGRAVLLAGDDLEDLGYVLEKSWAVDLGDGHAAVTTYEGEAKAPAIEGRFFVDTAPSCTTPQ